MILNPVVDFFVKLFNGVIKGGTNVVTNSIDGTGDLIRGQAEKWGDSSCFGADRVLQGCTTHTFPRGAKALKKTGGVVYDCVKKGADTLFSGPLQFVKDKYLYIYNSIKDQVQSL